MPKSALKHVQNRTQSRFLGLTFFSVFISQSLKDSSKNSILKFLFFLFLFEKNIEIILLILNLILGRISHAEIKKPKFSKEDVTVVFLLGFNYWIYQTEFCFKLKNKKKFNQKYIIKVDQEQEKEHKVQK